MSGDEAGNVERARPGELPENLAGGLGFQALGVGIVVLHVGKLQHQLGVRGVLSPSPDDELMQVAALVNPAFLVEIEVTAVRP